MSTSLAEPGTVGSSFNTTCKWTYTQHRSGEDNPDPPPRPKHRRASKACHPCSLRKVRCDVVRGGEPCTNCRLDEVHCFVGERRRGGGGERRRRLTAESRTAGISTDDQAAALNAGDREALHPGQSLWRESGLLRSPGHEAKKSTPSSYSEQASHMKTTTTPQKDDLDGLSPLRCVSRNASQSGSSTRLSVNLPPYIRPLPAAISQVDLDFLSAKGAFDLPPDSLRKALLDTYLRFVHPYMLVLDREDLLRAFHSGADFHVQGEADPRLSLILYWAILFAASSHVHISVLEEMGYDSRLVARRALFWRSKLLYDLYIEQDSVILLQAVLLMSYRFKETDNPRDSCRLLDFSTSFVQGMDLPGLIRNSVPLTKRQKLLRKLWWCCFVRDTLVVEQLMAPSKTKVEESDILPLTLDDFNVSQDSNTWVHTSAIIYISQTQLCIYINRILETHVSVAALTRSHSAFSYGTSGAAIGDLLSDKIRLYDADLTNWLKELSGDATLSPVNPDGTSPGDSSLQLQQILLRMTYLVALSILHRPQVLPSKSEVALATHINISVRMLSKDRMHHVATRTTDLAEAILLQQLSRYMPPYSVILLVTAITVHLMEIQFSHGPTRSDLCRKISTSVTLLYELREIYTEAGRSLDLLRPGLLKAGIPCSGSIKPLSLNGEYEPNEPLEVALSDDQAGRVGFGVELNNASLQPMTGSTKAANVAQLDASVPDLRGDGAMFDMFPDLFCPSPGIPASFPLHLLQGCSSAGGTGLGADQRPTGYPASRGHKRIQSG